MKAFLPALQELDLKVRQFEKLLRGPPALSEAKNINMLWAHLMVDELCRLGSSTFCIAPGTQSFSEAQYRHLSPHNCMQPIRAGASPTVHAASAHEKCFHGCCLLGAGSRSSPLTAAAAMHPRARIVTCIDERSLAFWALGFGQANG